MRGIPGTNYLFYIVRTYVSRIWQINILLAEERGNAAFIIRVSIERRRINFGSTCIDYKPVLFFSVCPLPRSGATLKITGPSRNQPPTYNPVSRYDPVSLLTRWGYCAEFFEFSTSDVAFDENNRLSAFSFSLSRLLLTSGAQIANLLKTSLSLLREKSCLVRS